MSGSVPPCVLVFDPDHDQRGALRHLLDAAGFSTLGATRLPEAERKLASHAVTIVAIGSAVPDAHRAAIAVRAPVQLVVNAGVRIETIVDEVRRCVRRAPPAKASAEPREVVSEPSRVTK